MTTTTDVRTHVLINSEPSPAALIAFGAMLRDAPLAAAVEAVGIAAAFIREHVTLPDPSDDAGVYLAVEEIALCMDGEQIAESSQKLDEMDTVWQEARERDADEPSAVACARWTPVVDAAFALGVAIGVQVGIAAALPVSRTDNGAEAGELTP